MPWKEYESKPVKRSAIKIEHECTLVELHELCYLDKESKEVIYFKAYQPVEIGDYIVRLTEEDTYHCTAKVFAERNVIPEGD